MTNAQNTPATIANSANHLGALNALTTQKQKDHFIEMVGNTLDDFCKVPHFGLKLAARLNTTIKANDWKRAEVQTILSRLLSENAAAMENDAMRGNQFETIVAIIDKGFSLALTGQTEYKPNPYEKGLSGEAHRQFEAAAFGFFRDHTKEFLTGDKSNDDYVRYIDGLMGEYLSNKGMGSQKNSINDVARNIRIPEIKAAFIAHMNAAYDELSGINQPPKPYVNVEPARSNVPFYWPSPSNDPSGRFEPFATAGRNR